MTAPTDHARQTQGPSAPPPRMMKPRRALLGLAILAAMGSATTLAGEVEESQAQPQELAPLTVTGDWLGTPTPEAARIYPGARTVVDSEALHQRGALNLEDALRATQGLTVLDETGTGILPNIGVRGLNPLRSQRVQLLVDGYPIAIGPYTNVGVSLFPVTLPSLQAVDVVRGGAAVHYGPNNVGGILNLVTRPIPVETEQTLRQRLTVAEESGHVLSDTYYRIGGAVSDKLGLQFQVNTQRGDGFRDHSDTEVNNFILDGHYFANDQHELAVQLQYYEVDAELPGALTPAAFDADLTQSQRPHDAYEADMLRGTLTWTYTPSSNVELQWRNFAHDADRTFFFGQRLGTGDHWADPGLPSTHVADSPRLFRVYGTEPRLTLRHGNQTLIAGVRYVKEEVEFDVNREVLATGTTSVARDWSFDTDAYAFYVSDTLRFMDDRLAVTPGIRYEDLNTDFKDNTSGASQDNDPSEWLPGLTVGFQADGALYLFANAQRSLVPVQTAQVTRGGDQANETGWNYELGARIQPRADLALSATLFRIDFEDQIQYNASTGLFENLGETRHQGIELTGNWQATDQLALGLGYTYLDTEQRNGDHAGNEVPNAPRHHLSAEAAYRLDQWTASLTGFYVSDSFSDAANTRTETANGSAGELPSYTLVNAYASRDIALDKGRVLNLAMGINNLLDEEYYFRGADVSPVGRVPGPDRALILEAQLDF